MKYKIVLKCISKNHWQVWWNGDMVYECKNEDAQRYASTFADGLEQGLTGSKTKLYANSRIKIKGWMDYLEAFDTYEDYKA